MVLGAPSWRVDSILLDAVRELLIAVVMRYTSLCQQDVMLQRRSIGSSDRRPDDIDEENLRMTRNNGSGMRLRLSARHVHGVHQIDPAIIPRAERVPTATANIPPTLTVHPIS